MVHLSFVTIGFTVRLALMVSIVCEQITAPTSFLKSLIRGLSETTVDAGRYLANARCHPRQSGFPLLVVLT